MNKRRLKKGITQPSFERRNGARVNRVVAIRHRLHPRTKADELYDWSLSSTKDMSFSGLLFMSHVPYKKNDLIELQVLMCGVVDIYSGLARVVRVRDVGETSFDIGVEYLRPNVPVRRAKAHFKHKKSAG